MAIDLELTAEQAQVRELAHRFAVAEMRPQAADLDERAAVPWGRSCAAPIDSESGPARAYRPCTGGGGLDPVSMLILGEELAWGDAGMAVSIMASGLAATAILAMGTESQRARYRGVLCDAETLHLGALGLLEPDSGSDALALGTRAIAVEDGWSLTGTKQFCTNGGIADLQVVFATTDPAAGPAGIAAFVVERGNSGMRQGRKERKLGVRASHTAQVLLDDCRVATDARLGWSPDGEAVGPGAAGALGIARAAYEFALDYAQTRLQFGRPIARHQAIAFKLADMATEIDAARLLAWQAGWMVEQGHPMTRGEGSMAKLFAGDVAMRVTVEAVQVLGGYGYTKEYPVERWMRDAKIYQIWEGTAEIQGLVISRLLGEERRATGAPVAR